MRRLPIQIAALQPVESDVPQHPQHCRDMPMRKERWIANPSDPTATPPFSKVRSLSTKPGGQSDKFRSVRFMTFAPTR